MKPDPSYELLTIPKVISMPFDKKSSKSMHVIFQNLLSVWGLKKTPFELDNTFRSLDRLEMIYHPHFLPMTINLIYCDSILSIKRDIIDIYMLRENVTVAENALCCFLYALYVTLHGFGYRDCIVEYDKRVSYKNIDALKESVLLWSGSKTMQGYHPIIWGFGTGHSFEYMAEEILDIRIRYTKQCIDEYLYISKSMSRETSSLLLGTLFDLGMSYAYSEILLALLQGSFSTDFLEIIKNGGIN